MGIADVHQSTILVADDDSLVRMSLRFALESRGYEVVEAADSSQLISNVTKQRPALCIVDVNMPGPAIADRIRTLREISPATAILVLSGDSGAPAAVSELGLPYLRKPIELTVLLDAVTEAIRHRSVAAAS